MTVTVTVLKQQNSVDLLEASKFRVGTKARATTHKTHRTHGALPPAAGLGGAVTVTVTVTVSVWSICFNMGQKSSALRSIITSRSRSL